jgi:hypothetical protein
MESLFGVCPAAWSALSRVFSCQSFTFSLPRSQKKDPEQRLARSRPTADPGPFGFLPT